MTSHAGAGGPEDDDATPSPWLSIGELADGLARGRFDVAALVEAALSRIDALDGALQAWSIVWPERARARARTLDALPASRRGPLHGVPMAVKDLGDVRGEPTRAGTVVLGDSPAREDATVVRLLEEAGAVILGKVKMTEGAFTSHHPSVTPPVNPWRHDRWTGISSSGSGVAVAAGLCTAALGTDTGGSIRFPSAACGLVGLKPTHGRVSLAGVFPLAPSLDHVGPMARRVDDVARIFAVLAGRDPRDPATRAAPPIDAAIAAFPHGLRVGFDPVTCADGVSPEIHDAVVRVVDALDASGARIHEVEMPPIGDALAAWLPICASEAATAHVATYPARGADYGPELAGLLETGLSASGRDVASAWQHRIAHTRALAAIFELCDVLVCPALAVELAAGMNLGATPPPPGAFTAMRFTLPFDLSGDPSLTLPCGLDRDGAPIGVQLVGPALTEPRLLAIAAHLEARGLCDIGHPELPLT